MGPVPKVCANKLLPLGAIRKSRALKSAGGHLSEFGYTNNRVLMDGALGFEFINSAYTVWLQAIVLDQAF
jgi:hypothetical protein